MARKKKPEEHENHERWLVSYADFITLLFAFFVVMYSISSVNEGKYRVLSDSITAAFDPTRDGLPIKLTSPLKPPIVERQMLTQSQSPAQVTSNYPVVDSGPQPTEEDKQNLREISRQVERGLAPFIDQDLVSVKSNDLWVEIEIKSNILFGSGSANLESRAQPVLRKIASVLKGTKNQIQVEGYTDNVPINTEVYPSNWELSAARAASVVHLFADAGLDPKRMVAMGYAEFKPIADNGTVEGRRKNRRISVIVQSDAIARRGNRTEQLEKNIAAQRQNRAQAAAPSDKPAVRTIQPINILPQRGGQAAPAGGR